MTGDDPGGHSDGRPRRLPRWRARWLPRWRPVERPGDDGGFRAKAARGVAIAALLLLLPFVAMSALQGRVGMAIGTAGIVLMVCANLWLVLRGRDHEPLMLYVFVPGGMLFMIHVFRVDGIIGSVWCYPSIVACYCTLGRTKALAANAIILAIATPMIWITVEPALSTRLVATLLAVSAFAHILVREIDAVQNRLRFQAEHDPLTGLLNRTSLTSRLALAVDAHARDGTPAALLALDLDHFKTVNDRFGHESGDKVLQEFAGLIHTCTGGAAFRMGGEEFLVLLVGREAARSRRVAETLRAGTEQAAMLPRHPMSVSVGLASLRPDDDQESWMRRGDEALYAAKRGGRNRVVVAPGTDEAARAADAVGGRRAAAVLESDA